MTAAAVAKELGVSERTVRRWISSGRLQAEKLNGKFEIDLDAARAVAAPHIAGSYESELLAYHEECAWLREMLELALRK